MQRFLSAIDGTEVARLCSTIARPVGYGHLTSAAFVAGGTINQAELVYHSGHGSRAAIDLDDGDVATKSEVSVPAAGMQLGGGPEGLKWLVFDACDTLSPGAPVNWSSVPALWSPAFKGLRLLLGFATTSQGWPERGKLFAHYLNEGETISGAWRMACEESEAGTAPAMWAYLSVVETALDTANDRWLPRVEPPLSDPHPTVAIVSGAT